MKKLTLILLFLGLSGLITLEVTTTYARGSFWLIRQLPGGRQEVDWTMVFFLAMQVVFPILLMPGHRAHNANLTPKKYRFWAMRWLNRFDAFIILMGMSIVGCASVFGTLALDPLAFVFSVAVGCFFSLIGWLISLLLNKKPAVS